MDSKNYRNKIWVYDLKPLGSYGYVFAISFQDCQLETNVAKKIEVEHTDIN